MNERVEKFLAQAKQDVIKKRNTHLINLGLYYNELVENPNNYPSNDLTVINGLYYKKVAIPVSDEEYTEICKYTKKPVKDNSVVTFLQVLVWVHYIGGALLGFIFLGFQDNTFFDGFLAVTIWFSFFCSGTFMLWLAEMLKLTYKISNK